MEAARPIVIEGEELILGFSGAEGHQSGLLLDARNRNVIEQVIERATRKRLRLRVITGETLQDWEAYRASQAEAARLQQQSREQYQKRTEAAQTWDAVAELLIRKFSGLEHRNLASVQGAYLAESVEVLAEAYGRLMSAPSEMDERNYSRALDRVSERVGVSSSLIAYLVAGVRCKARPASE
jgi:hypothetical protein